MEFGQTYNTDQIGIVLLCPYMVQMGEFANVYSCSQMFNFKRFYY